MRAVCAIVARGVYVASRLRRFYTGFTAAQRLGLVALISLVLERKSGFFITQCDKIRSFEAVGIVCAEQSKYTRFEFIDNKYICV